jgi:hypothetical protein
MAPPNRSQDPMTSLSPATTFAMSSGVVRPIFLPIRSIDSVRIWLILIHERSGRLWPELRGSG